MSSAEYARTMTATMDKRDLQFVPTEDQPHSGRNELDRLALQPDTNAEHTKWAVLREQSTVVLTQSIEQFRNNMRTVPLQIT